MPKPKTEAIACALAVVLLPSTAWAEDEDPPQNPELEIGDKHDAAAKKSHPGAASPARADVDPVSEPPKREDKDDPKAKFNVVGYIETFYQYNFNEPGNGISSYRGYDNRHNTFTLQNAVIDVGFRARDILSRVALQVGNAPPVIYDKEPTHQGSEGANASSPDLWRYIQRASLGWQATDRFLIEAGLFPNTTGVETFAVKENWNWSRSNASLALPNYRTGVYATYLASESIDVFASVNNGWNSVVDDNDEKSIVIGAHYKRGTRLTVSGSYFGGVERPGGAPEGRAWRHGLEAWAQWSVTDVLAIAADGTGGFEDTTFGRHWWSSAAAYARVEALEWLFFAARGDRLWEDTAGNGSGGSTSFLMPTKHVTSGTATVDVRPVKGLSTRLELKHDVARDPLYFRGETSSDAPNARSQTTVLLGATAWM